MLQLSVIPSTSPPPAVHEHGQHYTSTGSVIVRIAIPLNFMGHTRVQSHDPAKVMIQLGPEMGGMAVLPSRAPSPNTAQGLGHRELRQKTSRGLPFGILPPLRTPEPHGPCGQPAAVSSRSGDPPLSPPLHNCMEWLSTACPAPTPRSSP